MTLLLLASLMLAGDLVVLELDAKMLGTRFGLLTGGPSITWCWKELPIAIGPTAEYAGPVAAG
jgi:hypothetical protein